MAAHCRGATLASSEDSGAASSRPGVRVMHPTVGRAAAVARAGSRWGAWTRFAKAGPPEVGAVGGLDEPPSVDFGMAPRLLGRRKQPIHVSEPECFRRRRARHCPCLVARLSSEWLGPTKTRCSWTSAGRSFRGGRLRFHQRFRIRARGVRRVLSHELFSPRAFVISTSAQSFWSSTISVNWVFRGRLRAPRCAGQQSAGDSAGASQR